MKKILLLDNNILVYLLIIFKSGSNRELGKILTHILHKTRANAVWIPRCVKTEFLSVHRDRDRREKFLQKLETGLKRKGIELKECNIHNRTLINSLMKTFAKVDCGEADAHTQAESLSSTSPGRDIREVKFLTNDSAYLQWVSRRNLNFEIMDWNDVCRELQLNMGCRK